MPGKVCQLGKGFIFITIDIKFRGHRLYGDVKIDPVHHCQTCKWLKLVIINTPGESNAVNVEISGVKRLL